MTPKPQTDAADYAHLGQALAYCGALESLELLDMKGAGALTGVAPASLKSLVVCLCPGVTALPALDQCKGLEKLVLGGCSGLRHVEYG